MVSIVRVKYPHTLRFRRWCSMGSIVSLMLHHKLNNHAASSVKLQQIVLGAVKQRRRFANLRSSPAKEFRAVSTNCSPIIHIDKNSQHAPGKVFWRSGAMRRDPLLESRRCTWPLTDRTLRHTAGKNAKHPTLAHQRSTTSTPTPAQLLLHPWLLLCQATDCSVVSDASNRCWYNIYRWWDRLVFSSRQMSVDRQTNNQTFSLPGSLLYSATANHAFIWFQMRLSN